MKIEINSKKDAGKNLTLIHDMIENQAKLIDKLTGINIINCLIDANHTLYLFTLQKEFLHNLLLAYELQLKLNISGIKTSTLELRSALTRFFYSWYTEMEDSISWIWLKGKNGSLLSRSIGIISSIQVGNLGLEQIVKMANSEGYDSSSDFIYYRPTLLGSIFPITFTIFFQDLLNSKYQQTIINLMRLRELITVQNILHAALYTGYQYSIEITDESISFELKTDPEIVRKQLWSHPSTSPRTQQYSLLPDEWNYAAQELMAEGRQRVWSGEEKSSKNLTWFNKQFDSILGSYLILPNYSETFERWFGFPLLEFFNTIKSLMEISYYCVRSVAILTLRRAEVLVSKKTSYSRSRVRGLLSKLIYDGEGHPSKYPLIYVKPNLIISHTRLSQVFSNLMGGCIEEEYEPALKGPVFEEQCREIIRGRKIFVMPTNIEITEPYLPPTISMQLWGKEKEGTDLDVLAASNKLILLIEAKQRKYSETQARRHVSMKNQMEKFQNDLFRKAYWLSNNWNHFLANYLDPKYHNEFRNCECLLPFIVSTYASDKIETAPPVMTIKELDSLLDIFQKKKFFDKISQNRRTAKINGTEFELQFFKVIR